MGRGFGSLAFNVKNLQGNNLLSNGTFIIGSTTGAGSSTRKYLYCKQHNRNPSSCLYNIITISSQQAK